MKVFLKTLSVCQLMMSIRRLLFIFIVWLLGFHSAAQAVVVLQYHHVSEDTPASTSIKPKLFQQHMDYLSQHDFKVLSLTQFIDILSSKKEFPDKSVLITFDDGYLSIYQQAFPILKEKGFPFTVFINAKPIEQKLSQFMNWRMLVEMIEQGASIANHSYSHDHLVRLRADETESQWKARIIEDIQHNQQTLKKHLNQDWPAIAYPYGEYSKPLKQLLNETGYIGFGQHSGAVNGDVDQQAIPRFPFGGNYSQLSEFKEKVNAKAFTGLNASLLFGDVQLADDHLLLSLPTQLKLKIQLEEPALLAQIQCYYTGQGKLDKVINNQAAYFSVKDVPAGRSRFNCTAPSQQTGRYFWYSQPVIRPNSDGSWYKD